MQSHSPSSTGGCFDACGNIIDWDLIPSGWGGGGLSALTNTFTFILSGLSADWDLNLLINDSSNNDMDIVVDWGDGSSTTHITDYASVDASHNYTNGLVNSTLTITGKMKYLSFNNTPELTSIVSLTRDLGFEKLKFSSCVNLSNVNSNSIGKIGSLTDVSNMFFGCNSLNFIDNLFVSGYKITNADSVFSGCSNVGNVATFIFEKCINLVTASNMFNNCSSLSTIPNHFFDYILEAVDFSGVFKNSGITTIPIDLFAKNIKATTFTDAFYGIPTTTIPSNIFLYNTKIEYLDGCFNSCSNITTAVTGAGNFINQANTNATNEGITLTKTGCFDGCTSISDYASIPIGTTDWRTV